MEADQVTTDACARINRLPDEKPDKAQGAGKDPDESSKPEHMKQVIDVAASGPARPSTLRSPATLTNYTGRPSQSGWLANSEKEAARSSRRKTPWMQAYLLDERSVGVAIAEPLNSTFEGKLHMKMNKNDVAWYKSQVVVTVARRIEVTDYEFYMPDELLDKIRDRNIDVFSKLETFFRAYDEWWAYQEANQGRSRRAVGWSRNHAHDSNNFRAS